MALKMTAAQMVESARKRISELDNETLKEALKDPHLVLVDIRDIRERQRSGFISGSFHAPRGMIEFWVDPESPYHKDIFSQPGKCYVLYCGSGWRSALTVATLQDMGFDAAHLKDGFKSWVADGGAVEMMEPKDAP